MNSAILSQTDLIIFPLIAFVLFGSIFAGVLFWVFRPGSRAVYDARSRMILDETDTDTDTDTQHSSEGHHVRP